jgi:hypothetical protein
MIVLIWIGLKSMLATDSHIVTQRRNDKPIPIYPQSSESQTVESQIGLQI